MNNLARQATLGVTSLGFARLELDRLVFAWQAAIDAMWLGLVGRGFAGKD